jgi:tungstate transport system ATP-binding protein
MNALLSLRRLRKHVGTRLLLDIDEIAVNAGNAYVLTGANGAGKSTLLRILGGLESAETSEITFLGNPARLSPYSPAMRKEIVYVHQHPVMFSASVADNIGYGLAARGVSGAELSHRVEEAMAWAGVMHLRSSRGDWLSGGEKQRVALARAKVLMPKLLLLDEPTANLDGEAREQVIALIPRLVQSGSSVIVACHDRDLIGLPNVQRLKLRDGRLEVRTSAVPSTRHEEDGAAVSNYRNVFPLRRKR